MRVKKLNKNEPFLSCRKRLNVDKTIGIRSLIGKTVTDNWHTGYRSTGIETAGALHRLLYGT